MKGLNESSLTSGISGADIDQSPDPHICVKHAITYDDITPTDSLTSAFCLTHLSLCSWYTRRDFSSRYFSTYALHIIRYTHERQPSCVEMKERRVCLTLWRCHSPGSWPGWTSQSDWSCCCEPSWHFQKPEKTINKSLSHSWGSLCWDPDIIIDYTDTPSLSSTNNVQQDPKNSLIQHWRH